MKTLLRFSLIFFLSLFFVNSALAQNPVADFTTGTLCIDVQFNDASYDPGGNNIISWKWYFGDGDSSTTQNPYHIYPASGGNYTVTLIVNNDVGGADTAYQLINVSDLAIASIFPIDVNCFGSCDGAISVSVIGGVTAYTYIWSNGDTTQTATNLCAGGYSLTVTDAIGCNQTTSLIITEPPQMIGTVETSACLDTFGMGWATVNMTSGSAPFSYLWPNMQTTQTATNLSPGNYSMTVTDANGCTTSILASILDVPCDINVFGYVYKDDNFNCTIDTTEEMGGILVYTSPGPFYAYTNSSGYYQLNLDLGTYTIQTVNPNFHEANCPVQGFQTVTVTNLNDTIPDINIGLNATINCPVLQVAIGTGVLRPCWQSIIYVNYQNVGTEEALNSYIEVELDDSINYISSTIPYSSVNGNIYTFDLDTVDVFEGANFQILVYVACDMSLLGQSKCIEAEIFPQTVCTPPDTLWDHSSVMVTGACIGDSAACFIITNTGDLGGGDMLSSSDYRIFANDTLVFTGTFQLLGQDSIEICWPTNGRAIRLEADQHPQHPGNSHPQETIEDCGDANGTSLGFVTTTAFDDSDYFIDILCRVLIGSYDPNEKLVFPEGITDNHYIDNDVELNYQINFQNTGTDTAFTVVISDTLSDVHDITTLQNGVSSHPCTFTVFGEGILEWTFNNILLPDSNVNEPASHGFVTFTVKQKALTAGDYGTQILNEAGIYFDFNPPVITNTTDLMFWELPIIITHQPENILKENIVKIYPNPVTDILNIESSLLITELNLIDITGKKVITETNIDKIIKIDVNKLNTGLYFVHLTDVNGTVKVSKLIKK